MLPNASLHLVKYTCNGKWKMKNKKKKYTFLLLFSLSPKILHIPSFFCHLFHIHTHMHLLEIDQNIRYRNLEEEKIANRLIQDALTFRNGKGTTRHMTQELSNSTYDRARVSNESWNQFLPLPPFIRLHSSMSNIPTQWMLGLQ